MEGREGTMAKKRVCSDGGVLIQTSKHLLGEVESPWDEKHEDLMM